MSNPVKSETHLYLIQLINPTKHCVKMHLGCDRGCLLQYLDFGPVDEKMQELEISRWLEILLYMCTFRFQMSSI
jgi:hypothetical protein